MTKVETEKQLKTLKRKSAQVEADLNRQKKQEGEMLLQQQAAADFSAELEEAELEEGGREADYFHTGTTGKWYNTIEGRDSWSRIYLPISWVTRPVW